MLHLRTVIPEFRYEKYPESLYDIAPKETTSKKSVRTVLVPERGLQTRSLWFEDSHYNLSHCIEIMLLFSNHFQLIVALL